MARTSADTKQLKEAFLYTPLEGGRVRCILCARYCNIPEGKIGFCGVRQVIGGRLFTLNYGRLAAVAADPIEKKPLSHFHPGTLTLSIATVGCNFACQYCQNFDISQHRHVDEPYYPPEKIVRLAKNHHCQGVTGTYNEPTIEAEYLLDVMKLAKKEGLYTSWVSNGFMTPECVELVAPYLDGITVDFKGAGNINFYHKYVLVTSSEPIFTTLKELKKRGVHIEVTNLVVPVNTGAAMEDIRRLAMWIRDSLGDETPFHLLRFHPDYKMMDVPWTPLDTLVAGRNIAKEEAGLKYVYLGNVWEREYENTYCPNCRQLCIERHHLGLVTNHLKEGTKCPKCGYKIYLRT